MNKKLLLFFAILCLIPTAVAQSLKPEKVFELHFKTLVNADENSRKQVNDYLKPLYEGSELYPQSGSAFFTTLIENSAEGILATAPKKDQPKLKPSVVAFFEEMYKNMQKTEVKIIKTEITDNEYVDHQKIASVSYQYTLHLPAKGALSALNTLNLKKMKPEETILLFEKMKKELQNTSRKMNMENTIDLYSQKYEGKTYYDSGSTYEILTQLTDGYMNALQE